MKKKYLYIILVLLLFSCDTSKQFVTNADKLANEGYYDEAANYYYNALLLKPDNVTAKEGLKKTAQKVLDVKFNYFSKYVVDEKVDEAVMQFGYNRKYYDKAKQVGVELNWLEMYNEVYEDIKNEFIERNYNSALELMKQNKYDKAEDMFEKMAAVDSEYKSVSVLRLGTVLEPMYQRGLIQLQNGEYKIAVNTFDRILSYDKNYKNTKQLYDEAKQKAIVTVGVFLTNTASYPGAEDLKFYENLLAKMEINPGPFLKITNSETIEKLLHNQQIYFSAKLSQDSMVQAGRQIGIDYFLLIDVSEVKYFEQALRADTVIAYESFSEKVMDPATGNTQSITRFKEANYIEMNQSREVKMRVFYQLLSMNSNRVETSEIILGGKRDEQSFAQFDGNYLNLYETLPNGNYIPTPKTEWRDKFTNYKRELAPSFKLLNESFDEIALKISDSLNLYFEK